MSDNKHSRGCRRRGLDSQCGAYAVEFSLVLAIFLMFVLGILEVARAIYMINTLQDVTRRAASAAARTDFTDEGAQDRLRQRAIFRTTPGTLLLGDPVTDEHIRIDYMALVRDAGGNSTLATIPAASMPTCPARNRIICMVNPNDASCIRFVRVQICEPGNAGECQAVRYRTIASLINLPLDLPKATTIVPAETLGFTVGNGPCL